ncbi:MAG: hypothetical protein J0I29_05090 [Rhizobiales bacterium]|nr:hypothetical protein [Hyphomicrobiales bacterium]
MIDSFASWLRSAFVRLRAKREMDQLCQSDLERIAADLGVSPSELCANSATNRDWRRLLDERIRQFGLDRAALDEDFPRVVRDLERTCGRCGSASRCENDFKRSGLETISGYCPNTHTLNALSKESKNISKR